MITKRFAQLLQTLADNPNGLTTAEVLKRVDDLPDGQIVDVNECSRLVYNCRGNGFLTTFEDGKKNRHTITPKGLEELNEYHNKSNQPKPLDMDRGTESAAEAEKTLDETVGDAAVVDTLEEPQAGAEPMESAQEQDDLALQTETLATDSALETLARDGYLFLDPNDEIESALITMAHYMRSARELQSAPVIAEKCLKIDTLRSLANMMSEDICRVLENVADDLEKLEAA